MRLITLIPGVIFSSDVFVPRPVAPVPVRAEKGRDAPENTPRESADEGTDDADAQSGLF